ncbi:MAG TPA: PBSX family phage terminase large subunit [Ruminococcus sp.]|nr:PBSX family phage terminase large subunit [Ruminococcus sp.]
MLCPFSPKQLQVLNWWHSPDTAACDAVICDGAVRSGKTTALTLSFFLWASACFHGQAFAVCAKTKTNAYRNLIRPICGLLRSLHAQVNESPSKSLVTVQFAGHTNDFYVFGGKDESAAPLIQGMTLAGVLLDEVALMPRSFVEQAIARCSLPNAKLWFSCNPDQPAHWFYQEWICKSAEKHALYLHFTMQDNPAMTPEIRSRYERLYSGAFYDRFVRGIWTAAHGLVYPMFSPAYHITEPPLHPDRFAVSCDYGTVNPASFGLWAHENQCWFRIAECYYDSRKTGISRTDEEHYDALVQLIGEREITKIVVDPSAASFIACIRKHGRFVVEPAKNDVLSGIRRTADAIRNGEIKICPACTDTIREFSQYVWDEHAQRDQPVKEHDHAMDDIRYFVSSVIAPANHDDFFAASIPRA